MEIRDAMDVTAAVQQVASAANQGDYETAHSVEDELYAAVLEAVSKGRRGAQRMATIALATRSIEFDRHKA